ncbi:MAG TPA: preprotein translocase subunit TatC, partial [Bacteroidetes bacterium]|nr:preprotein translocase subunit TatC [Bacteroidota bacterium]
MEVFSGKKKNVKKLPNPEKEMSFLDHLEELRWTIIRSVLYIVVIAIVVFIAKKFIFNYVIFSQLNENFPTYRFFCFLGDRFCIKPPQLHLITRAMGEQFLVHIKVSMVLGFIVSFPLILREVWKFVSPGLKETERKVTFN